MLEVRVTPDPSPADAPPVVTGRGIEPGAQADIVIDVGDAAGHAWRSTTSIRADADGTVDTGRDLDDPTRPWWDMAFRNGKRAPVTFEAPSDLLLATITLVTAAGSVSCPCTRRWGGSLPTWTSSGEGYELTVTIPAGDGPFPAVFVVPGTTGVAAVQPLAGLLAAHGYVAGIVTYMEAEQLPAALEEVPIEAVMLAFADLAARPEVDRNRIAVHASSVGTGGALLMLSGDNPPPVRAVVLVAPTSVVWQAPPSQGAPPKLSSWSYAGTPLPWLPTAPNKLLGQMLKRGVVDRFKRGPRPTAMAMLPAYTAGLQKLAEHPDALIPVENVTPPMLVLSGAADAMWPSSAMARAIVERRNRADDRAVDLPDTGHFIRPPVIPTTIGWSAALVSGGTAPGSAAGTVRAWTETLEFLATQLR